MVTNWSGNVTLNATEYRPTSPAVLKTTLEQLFNEGKKVRGLGGRFSTSHVMAPAAGGETISARDLLLDRKPGEKSPPKVALLKSRDPASWYRSSTSGLVAVSAGATVDDVNRYLTAEKRSLAMMGAFSGQTFVGAMLTSTHGSSGTIGPLADLVVSLDVVTIDAGRVVRYRIERNHGPTHASNYEGATGHKVFQDDDLFHAFVVSFGYLGIVTGVVVRTLPLFRLKHGNELLTWTRVKERFAQHDGDGIPSALKNSYALSVTMGPYARADGEFPTCIWNEVRKTSAAVTPDSSPGPFASAGALLPFVVPVASSAHIPAAIDSTLQMQVRPGSRVDIAHKILTSPRGFPVKGYGLEFAFPVGPDLSYVDAITKLLAEVATLEIALPVSSHCVSCAPATRTSLSPTE